MTRPDSPLSCASEGKYQSCALLPGQAQAVVSAPFWSLCDTIWKTQLLNYGLVCLEKLVCSLKQAGLLQKSGFLTA